MTGLREQTVQLIEEIAESLGQIGEGDWTPQDFLLVRAANLLVDWKMVLMSEPEHPDWCHWGKGCCGCKCGAVEWGTYDPSVDDEEFVDE